MLTRLFLPLLLTFFGATAAVFALPTDSTKAGDKTKYHWNTTNLFYPNGKKKLTVKTKTFRSAGSRKGHLVLGATQKSIIVTMDYYENGKRKTYEKMTKYTSSCWGDRSTYVIKQYSEKGRLIKMNNSTIGK